MTLRVCRNLGRVLCVLGLLIFALVGSAGGREAEQRPARPQPVENLVEIPAAEGAPVELKPGEPADGTDLRLLIPLVFLLIAFWALFRARSADGTGRARWLQLGAVSLFLAFLSGGVILAQQRDGDDDATTTRTRSRRGTCELAGAFALRVVFDGDTSRDILFVELEPGLEIDSPSGRLVMKEKDVSVVRGSFPGTIKFRFRRGADGTQVFFEREQRVASNDDIPALVADIGRNPPEMGPPPGLNAQNTPITERLQGEVDYDPDYLS
jgi:hypothetical protein